MTYTDARHRFDAALEGLLDEAGAIPDVAPADMLELARTMLHATIDGEIDRREGELVAECSREHSANVRGRFVDGSRPGVS